MRTTRRPPVAVAVLLVAACLLSGNAASSPGDAGATEEEATVADESERLAWTVGSWEGVRRAGDDGSEEPMTLRVEPILGGAGQAFHLEVRHDGDVYRGFAVQVYEPESGRWVRQYINAVHRRFARLEGAPDGQRMVWRSATPGRGRESRMVEERPSPDSWLRTQSISEDGGESWRVLFVDDLRRVGDADGEGGS